MKEASLWSFFLYRKKQKCVVVKKEKEILDRYILGAKTLSRKEHYEAGIYIKDVENLIGYNTEENKNDIEYMENKEHKQKKNQILLLEEELKKMKFENKKWKMLLNLG